MSAAAGLFQSGPAEVLQEIVSHASSLQDVLSFDLICKHAHQAWLAQNAGLRAAWNVLARGLPAAEQALVAHRASEIAAGAEQTQRPVRPIATLRGAQKTPNASELAGVQQMHRLALALDAVFQNSEYAVPGDYDGITAPEEPDRMDDWRVGMHAAIYRSFTIGAALSGVYGEAYAKADATPEIAVPQGIDTVQRRERRDEVLNSFAVLRDSMTEEEEDAAFGPQADWLLHDLRSDQATASMMEARFATGSGRARSCLARQAASDAGCPAQLTAGGTHAEAHAVALQLLHLLWASRHIMDMLDRNAAENPAHHQHLQAVPVGPVFPYGVFQSRIAHLPKLDCEPSYLHCSFAAPPAAWVNHLRNGYWFIQSHFDEDDCPSGLTGNDVFPAFLQARFFVYFLRKHMKLAFHPQFFQTNHTVTWIDNDWDAFHHSLLIFSLDDVEGREAYYPDCAASQHFPYDGFLDGADLLVSSDRLQEIAASSS